MEREKDVDIEGLAKAAGEEFIFFDSESSSSSSSSGTQIQNKYCFWYHRRGGRRNQNTNYEEAIKKLASFQTVEHFWHIYDHLIRPNDIKGTTDYHLFRDGVKPTWEDPQNQNGGKWMVRLKKGLASKYWEELVIAIIGEQFDVGNEICGAVVSTRGNEDIISVWNKTNDNQEAINKIRDQLRRILKLPIFIQLEYKKHQDSLQDKSSYRNPTMVYKPPERSHMNPQRDREAPGLTRSATNSISNQMGGNKQYYRDQNNDKSNSDINRPTWGDSSRIKGTGDNKGSGGSGGDGSGRSSDWKPNKSWGQSTDRGDQQRDRTGWSQQKPQQQQQQQQQLVETKRVNDGDDKWSRGLRKPPITTEGDSSSAADH